MRLTRAIAIFVASSLWAAVPSHATSLRRSLRFEGQDEDSRRSLQETQAPAETEAPMDTVEPTTLSTYAPEGDADGPAMVNPSQSSNGNSTRTTIALNGYENQLYSYLQYVRTASGLTAFSIALDAVQEGQRWAKRMASTGVVDQRSSLTININPNWRALAEMDVSKQDIRLWVSTDTQLRKYIKDANFNRVGFGVVKKGSVFFICVIFKAM